MKLTFYSDAKDIEDMRKKVNPEAVKDWCGFWSCRLCESGLDYLCECVIN